MLHPAQRFVAPRSITGGVPLKDLLDRTAIDLLGESFAAVHPSFDRSVFARQARRGLDDLALMPRADHLATALAAQLPPDPAPLAEVLIAALGPRQTATAGLGLAVFFYLPHSALIRQALIADVEAGLRANYALTSRFTAEYSIRPFLLAYPERTLAALTTWASDPDPHVRRLVSEGTRPRLPWAGRLVPFQRDPTPTLALLERLKDDPELYVRRSVANHLGDIAKDHPALALATARRWLEEAAVLPSPQADHRRWLIRHAVRLPAQRGDPQAVAVRRAAGGR